MKNILVILALVFLVGCATSYERNGFNGGFSDTQISANMFKVYFEGNSNTSVERASDFLLLRSAELTLREGYKYFTVSDKQEVIEKDSFTTPLRVRTKGKTHRISTLDASDEDLKTLDTLAHGSSDVRISGGKTYLIEKPRSSQMITCYKVKPSSGFSYDAGFLSNSLREKYELE